MKSPRPAEGRVLTGQGYGGARPGVLDLAKSLAPLHLFTAKDRRSESYAVLQSSDVRIFRGLMFLGCPVSDRRWVAEWCGSHFEVVTLRRNRRDAPSEQLPIR